LLVFNVYVACTSILVTFTVSFLNRCLLVPFWVIL